jgi:CheY-like chemotaxis protein
MARVGLLEDNARIARLSATILEFAGHSVTTYAQGCALLEVFSTPSSHTSLCVPALPLDVVILDLFLPDMSGIEVIRSLQVNEHTRSLPVIFCTAANSYEIKEALCVAPHACVVEKPFKLHALVEAVRIAVKTRDEQKI